MEIPKNQISFRKIVAEISGDFRSTRLAPGIASGLVIGLLAGLVIGLLEVIVAISFSALIYSGDISSFIGIGIGFALIGAIITGVVVTLVSSLPGTISGIQDAPAAILALMAAAIIASMPRDATSLDTFITVAVAIAVTTFICGIFLLGLGYFNLGELVRFLPYPVVGGFLAGTGWLLVVGSISLMTDITPSLVEISTLFQVEILIRWLPGLIFALVLMVILNRYNHFLLLLGLVFGGFVTFYLVMWLAGFSILEASANGWLLGPFPEGNFFQSIPLSALADVDWTLISAQIGNMVTILIISAFALLLNISSLELVAKEDMDVNRELRAAGVSNVFTGFFAGLVGFQQLSFSAMNQKIGAQTRLTGLLAVAVCIVALVAGTAFIAILPKVVFASLLLYFGMTFLYEFAYETWFELPKADYFIILLILVVIATAGFLEGVVVGILAAVILFAVNYSKVDVIKHSLTGATYKSTIARPKMHARLLQRYGKRILILELQGYIFFGTANNLLEQIRAHINQYANTRLCFLLLDFSHVTGIDSSVAVTFRKMDQLLQQSNASIVLTGLSVKILTFLQKSGFFDIDEDSFHISTDLDHGVEWCEYKLLQSTGVLERDTEKSFHDQLKILIGDSELIHRIINYLERQELAAGEYIINQGDSPGDLYFLEDGIVTVQLEIPGEVPRRLNTLSSENLVGELGFYLGSKRNASVVTETQTTIYKLTAESLKKMETEEPEAAALFHKFIAHVMAEKLSHLMATVETLMR
jgi:SulP family sulfate permease